MPEILPQQGDFFKASSSQDFLEKLRKAITMRLRVLNIELQADDNPSNIYYSLNFKQEPLSDADLIRNYIFMEFKSFEEQEQFNTAHWGKFEELFGVTEQLQASKESTKEKEDLSNFYYRYLLAKEGYFPYKRLYSQFSNYADDFIKGNSKALPKLVADLKRFANYSISILSLCKDPELESAFKRFRQLGHETPMPLLFHLYNKYEEDRQFKSTFLEILRGCSQIRTTRCDEISTTIHP